MEKTIHLTVDELEQVKARLSQLEEAFGVGGGFDGVGVAASENTVRPAPKRSTPLLPIAELKQIAEMARRFR
jgi:hypothetical protein